VPIVNMPAGCESLKFGDGKAYYGKPGGHVNVADEHAAQIAKSSNGQLGIVSGAQALVIGTKKGMWCRDCSRLWQAWSSFCPKCNQPTVPE
jgi:Zn finger protein HypA/HybF involved in hydrogenase expression